MRVAKFKAGDEEIDIPVPPGGDDMHAQKIAKQIVPEPKLQGFYQIPFRFRSKGKRPVRRSTSSAAWKLWPHEETTLVNNELTAISTGVVLQLPPGYAGYLLGTATALEKSILVCAGLIDSENDQPIYIRALAIGEKPIIVKKNKFPIAQVAIMRLAELPTNLEEKNQ